MITPRGRDNATHPLGFDDVVAYLGRPRRSRGRTDREVEIDRPDALSYADMLDRTARALGRRPRPKVRADTLVAALPAVMGLLTPVDAGVARRPSRPNYAHDRPRPLGGGAVQCHPSRSTRSPEEREAA
jgi:hypothetical protein